jgi:hypothetical protein
LSPLHATGGWSVAPIKHDTSPFSAPPHTRALPFLDPSSNRSHRNPLPIPWPSPSHLSCSLQRAAEEIQIRSVPPASAPSVGISIVRCGDGGDAAAAAGGRRRWSPREATHRLPLPPHRRGAPAALPPPQGARVPPPRRHHPRRRPLAPPPMGSRPTRYPSLSLLSPAPRPRALFDWFPRARALASRVRIAAQLIRDILAARAGDAGEERFFFHLPATRCWRGAGRAAGAGVWRASGKEKLVASPRCKLPVGAKRTLVFCHRGGKRTDWLMHEYRLLPAGLLLLNGTPSPASPHVRILYLATARTSTPDYELIACISLLGESFSFR